ncbi:MAG TPA: hypothetical protein VK502_02865 [Candidatus Saccharimonadales bacterium]|nr:hypothetical protein [Candidatus Saccharimonadales bacterium]
MHPLFLRRSASSDSATKSVNHHELPTGTVLSFIDTKGSIFRIELLDNVFEGHSRRVKVQDAPVKYNPAIEPTIMCVVPRAARIKLMAHAYNAAIPTVGAGNVVYLIDRYASGPVRPFIVRSMEQLD